VTDTHDAPTEMPELPEVTHAFVTLSTGLRMHVAEAGNPDATTVLLLHGFPVGMAQGHPARSPSATEWARPTCAALVGRTHRTTGTPWAMFSPTCSRCSTRSGFGGSGWSPTTSASSLVSGSASTAPNVSPPFSGSARTQEETALHARGKAYT
jgi:hypothetical protein